MYTLQNRSSSKQRINVLPRKQFGEVNMIHKKGAKEECPCYLGLYLKGKKKGGGMGGEKVQETRLVNLQLVSPNHTI